MSKRKIFDEVMEGVAAMKSHRERKITLRTYKVQAAPLPSVDSKLIRDTRKRLRCSRAVFARKLISFIKYEDQTVTVLEILTHKEYDKGGWKSACNC